MEQSEGKLYNQVAIVTGAAQGMGAAIAGRLAAEGAKVVLSDISVEKVAQVAERINAATGDSAISMKTDVTKEDEVAEMVEMAIEHYGTVSILVNNAGILYPTRIDHVTKAEWDEVLDVNLNGSFLCSKAVLPIMKTNQFWSHRQYVLICGQKCQHTRRRSLHRCQSGCPRLDAGDGERGCPLRYHCQCDLSRINRYGDGTGELFP